VEVTPLKETKVKLLETWGRKSFAVHSNQNQGELHITYGWGHVITSTYGYALKQHKTQDQNTPEIADTTVTYEKPYERSYQAPVLKFGLSSQAR
jgi:hypothetical protein